MARGRPKGAENQIIMDRRMKALALRRDGHTVASIADELDTSASAITSDMRWLREQGYDMGEVMRGALPNPAARDHRQLRPAGTPDDESAIRRQVSDRRVQGESILMISIAMKITAHEVRRYLHETNRIAAEGDIEARRELQFARLEDLLLKLRPGIDEGSPKSINAAVRVMAEIHRLGGLYRPIQVEHTVITVDAIDAEIARLSEQLSGLRSSHAIEGTFELSDADD